MKRLFGKFSRPQTPAAEEPVDVPAVGSDTAGLPNPVMPETHRNEDALDFELREPTPEEISATILSKQDFIDLDKMFGHDPAAKRTVHLAKAPILSPAVAVPVHGPTDVPAGPAKSVPVVADTPPASEGEIETSENAANAPHGEGVAAIEVKPALVGFLEGFFLGKVLGGWVGDPDEPECRSICVTAYLDGKEISGTIANRERTDIPYAGFHIPFPDEQVWKYVLEDRLIVKAAREGGEPVLLQPLEQVFRQAHAVRADIIGDAASAGGNKADTYFIPKPHDIQDLALVRVPLGLESRDGAAIIGRDGFLFTYRDATNLAAQYAIAPAQEEAVQRDAARWFLLFRARDTALSSLGATYVQAIMPEKATILNDLTPAGLGPITARLAVLDRLVETEAHNDETPSVAYYRSFVTALRSCHTAGVAPFLRTADALRTAGTQLVFYLLVQKMAALLPDHAGEFEAIAELCGHLVRGNESGPLLGELGLRFDIPLYETEQLPDLANLEPYAVGARMVPTPNDATSILWRNESAPSQLKVMVFGSSCLGQHEEAGDLAWWFKAMFAEFRFSTTLEIDIACVEQHRPDVVIALCPERMLPFPPTN